jgi:hypothetical protein
VGDGIIFCSPRYNFFDHYNSGFAYNRYLTKYSISHLFDKLYRFDKFSSASREYEGHRIANNPSEDKSNGLGTKGLGIGPKNPRPN